MSEFYLKAPVIIEGASAHWRDWVFSRQNLEKNYSQLPASALQKIGASFDHICEGVEPVRTTLGAYFDAGLTLPPELAPPGGMPVRPSSPLPISESQKA